MSIRYSFSSGEVINNFSPNTYTGLLAANTEQTLTVPDISPDCAGIPQSNKLVAVISVAGISGLWVSVNSEVTVPSSTISEASGELVTNFYSFKKLVTAGDVLHFISSTANTQFGVAFYVSNQG